MNWACGIAVGLAAILAGCDNKDSADSEVKTLQARVSGLTRENAGLKTTADTLKAENTAMDRKMAGLKSENIQLKRQLELAQAAAAKPATAPAAVPAVASNTMESATGIVVQGGRLPVPKTPDRPAEAEEPAAVTLKKSLADLEARIAALRTKVVLARNKIMDLSRSSIDVQTPMPAGGIVKDGNIYRKEGLIVAPYYQYVLVGPVVKKGDFRTSSEKDEAIKKAKEEFKPLDAELKSLIAEQAALRSKLKMTTPTPEPPDEQPAAEPAR